jgi:hypothetical protein
MEADVKGNVILSARDAGFIVRKLRGLLKAAEAAPDLFDTREHERLHNLVSRINHRLPHKGESRRNGTEEEYRESERMQAPLKPKGRVKRRYRSVVLLGRTAAEDVRRGGDL